MPESDRKNEVQGRVQVRRAAHKEKAAVRASEIDSIKHSYARIKDEPAFRDILAKAKSFAAYHTKMAKDGVGYRDTGRFDENGKPIQEIVYYDQPKRLSELDKASGIEELEDYMLRQLTAAAKVEVEEEVEAEVESAETTEKPATDETVA
jgi:hypothetical protein